MSRKGQAHRECRNRERQGSLPDEAILPLPAEALNMPSRQHTFVANW